MNAGKSKMNMKGGYEVGSGNLNKSDVIFSPEEIRKENSIQDLKLNGPVYI